MTAVERDRLRDLMEREERRFVADHTRSLELHQRAKGSMLSGVPMNWMTRWAGGFPMYVDHARGAHFVDVDGREYVDFCLGDTGAMAGHAPPPTVKAIAEQAARGITFMLPTEDATWVGEELARRFGLPQWQFALTATDANRFAIRLARALTGRPKVLVFNWCYHGTVDETFASLDGNGHVVEREGSLGPPVQPGETTKVVEFNDVDGLATALEPGDVACVLAEPALTNIGIVLPDPGYHEQLRELTRRNGTLLVIDETHTICSGPGGYTRVNGLQPDVLTLGKAIAAGVPAAVYGFTADIAERLEPLTSEREADTAGIGGTLAANALSMAAMRATLGEVLTDEAFARMIVLAERFTAGVDATISERALPWHITRMGCRAEYLFSPDRPRTGSEAASNVDHALDAFMHLYTLNRGILLTPFHNMALMSPATTEADVDRHTAVYAEAADELLGRG
jgi:glutamate-1-semialdehyde 2,1-aminomutase